MASQAHELTFDAGTSMSAKQLLDRISHSGDDWAVRRSELDPKIASLIEAVLRSVAEGEQITVGRIPEIVTTTTAASLLGISRPTLVKHIREGRLPSHSVGTHMRLRRDDVLEFRKVLRADRARAVQQLMELEDELGEPL